MKMAPAPAPTAAATASTLASHRHHQHHHNEPHQQFHVTEDTPVDYLEGCMEVLVVFPNEKSIPMSIQRRMPMLDLLIHVTAANKLSPAAHLLQVTDEDGRVLPQKPSTPIGSLNAHKVYIVPKNRLTGKPGSRPTYQAKTVTHFEPTFRIQVRLPRNQLFVTRVTARTQLADLLHTVCNEKDLEPSHYEFRHPVNHDERLKLSATLDDYKITEVLLVHVPLTDSGQHRRQPPSPSPVPPTPTPTPSCDDPAAAAAAMSNKKSHVAHTNSANVMSGGKSALRSTASEAALNHVSGEKKRRGLFGLLGFGKHKKGSSMGDSSVSSDSVGDRSISPTRSDEPAPEPTPQQPRPPSPVLVSKRLAEEAVAKRNSRLLMNQKSVEAAALGTVAEPSKPAAVQNGSVKAPTARSAGKKRMAPPPPAASVPPAAPAPSAAAPAPAARAPSANGLTKAESEVSTYTTCSSGSSGVSQPISVIDNASLREATPSPIPSQRPASMPSYKTPMSHEGSPERGHAAGSANLLSTPRVSSTNLTAVSSTSNPSLSSVVKKRKAPVPPPALEEHQTEAGADWPSVPKASSTIESNGHAAAESDATSESASDVSAGSPKSRTAPPPAAAASSPRAVRRVSSGSSRQASPGGSDAAVATAAGRRAGPPKPAPRTRKSYIEELAPRSNEKRPSIASTVSANRDDRSNGNGRKHSLASEDDLNMDDESLSMFAEKTPTDGRGIDIDPHELVMRQQLELAARQKAELEIEKRIAQEKVQLKQAEKQKIQSLLDTERRQLGKIGHPSATSGEAAKPRKRWNKGSPDIKFERWSSSSSDDDDETARKAGSVDATLLTAHERRSRANSVDTEFYSLSESEDKQVKELSKHSPTLWQPRLSDGSGRSDPDADFAAMCEALARRKQCKSNSALPSDLSQVPVEFLQSPHEAASSDGDDLSPTSAKKAWRRSNSEPSWTIEEEAPTSPGSRSVHNLEDFKHKSPSDPASSVLFSLNDTSLSSTSSYRGEHVGFVNEGPETLSWQPEVESVRSSSPSEASERPGDAHSDDDYEVLRQHNQNVNQSDGERKIDVAESERLTKADSVVEHVEAEALYSMIIKSTNGVRVVNLPHVDEICDSPKEDHARVESLATNEAAEPTEKVAPEEVIAEQEPEVERSPEERTESPVMWEFKLPAPPTPFADFGDGSPVADKVSIKSDSGSDRSRHSSMSTDSLQEPEPEAVQLDDKEPIPDSAARQDSPTFAHNNNKVTLERGNELAGESRTEDPPAQVLELARTPSPPLMKQDKVSLDETVSDESLSSFVPPLPLTLPPVIHDGGKEEDEVLVADPIEPPQIYQEEKVDSERERSDSHSSSHSSSASSHCEPPDLTPTSQGEANEAKSPSPEPAVKEPDVIVNHPTAPTSGSPGVNGAPAFLPLMNVDFIHQFQAALTTISDPQARALQEEFLRLQQQFLTWQLHAAAQQTVGIQPQQPTLAQAMATMPAVSQTTYPIVESPALAEDKQEAQPPVVEQTPVVQDSEPLAERTVIAVVQSEPSEVPAQMESPAEKEKSSSSSDESSDEAEEPVYRYAGPPQVKLDTWKPGRPRSEVIDYSNTLSFNIPSYSAGAEPKSKIESKISTFEMGTMSASRISSRPASASPTPTAAPSAGASATPATSTIVTAPKTFVINKVATDPERKDVKSPRQDGEADSRSHSPVKLTEGVKLKKEELPKAEPKKEEKLDAKRDDETKTNNDEADLSSGVRDKVGRFESNIDKSVVLRKSSFVTPRPFEPRPVSMPIKRPAIVPAVIQPVPFVSRKIQRAPEVRGFASLPSPEHADPVKVIGSGEHGPAPFGSKPRPTSVASKENPTIAIRNKLLESSRRPSAELEQPPILPAEANEESRGNRSAPETVEDKRPTPAARPLTMPASSSLILAASADSSPKKEPVHAPVNAPPPPAMLPAAPSTPAKRPMPSRFERKIDPREELLNSIRNFGMNGGTLRKTGSRIN